MVRVVIVWLDHLTGTGLLFAHTDDTDDACDDGYQ